jgi:hypothetical protein
MQIAPFNNSKISNIVALGASEAKEKKPPAWNISLRQG